MYFNYCLVYEIDANVSSNKLDRIKLDKIAGKLMAMSVEPVRVAIYLNLDIRNRSLNYQYLYTCHNWHIAK